jgi:hypothetical protein
MIIERDLKKFLNQLGQEKMGQIEIEGTNIVMRAVHQNSKFSLSTPVYFGGNFIPKSVRNCLSEKKSLSDDLLKTYLTIDENSCKIYLNYFGSLDNINSIKLGNLIEEFHSMAEKWRLILDERDRHDLVHVRVS